MKLTEYIEVTQKQKVTIGYECDNCGKIDNSKKISDDWHEFAAYFYDENYDNYMACSPECYLKLLQQAVEELKNYEDAVIDNFKIAFAKRLVAFFS